MNNTKLTSLKDSFSGSEVEIVYDVELLNSLGNDVDAAYDVEHNEIVLRDDFERVSLLHETVHFLFNIGNEKLHDWINFMLENDYFDIPFWYHTLVEVAGYEFNNDTEFIDEIVAHEIERDYLDGIKSNIINDIPLLNDIFSGKYGGRK